MQFHVKDSTIESTAIELNGPVYEDSAVEWFVSPSGADDWYFKFEINCVGIIYLGWGPNRSDRPLGSHAAAEHIQVVTSEPGPTRESHPDDESWWQRYRLRHCTTCRSWR